MNEKWAAQTELKNAASLAKLRGIPNVAAAIDNASIWLVGDRLDKKLRTLLRSTPNLVRYELLDDGQLIPAHRVVPDGRLPNLELVPLGELILPKLPAACWPGTVSSKATPQLKRGSTVSELNLIVASLDDWYEFVCGTAEVRLEQWVFAACGDGRIVVRGDPVPPIRANYFCENSGIAVPAGWEWAPNLDAAQIRTALCSNNFEICEGDILLFATDGSWERIAQEYFVAATRSAVRLTRQQLAEEPRSGGTGLGAGS